LDKPRPCCENKQWDEKVSFILLNYFHKIKYFSQSRPATANATPSANVRQASFGILSLAIAFARRKSNANPTPSSDISIQVLVVVFAKLQSSQDAPLVSTTLSAVARPRTNIAWASALKLPTGMGTFALASKPRLVSREILLPLMKLIKIKQKFDLGSLRS
jgi:hypothetical protein